MPHFYLVLATLGSAILVPLIAGYLVWTASPPPGSRVAEWIGLSLGLGTATTLPGFAFFLTVMGWQVGYASPSPSP